MVGKLAKKNRGAKGSKPSQRIHWNGHFTLACCSFLLLVLSFAVIWEDLGYRETRAESMKALLDWDRGDETFRKSSLAASKKNEYRQSLKLAIGYLKEYKRDRKAHRTALALSLVQLKIALGQMDEASREGSIGKKVTSKLKEVELLMEEASSSTSNDDGESK
jgi:hypothetical protein